MQDSKYVVAAYDFRSKQEYIYRTNRVKEIMGASEILRTAFSDAINAYEGRIDKSTVGSFSLSAFEESPQAGTVLYEGGGSHVMLFKGDEEFLAFNSHFSRLLIEKAPGLSPVCGKAEYSSLNDKTFKEVTAKLFDGLDEYKRLSAPLAEANVLPFTQIDRKTTLPVVKKITSPKEDSLSAESVAKLEKFSTISEEDVQGEKAHKDVYAQNFDRLITKKGTESLLAIIYIDGNSMGKRVREYIGEDIAFEDGVNKQREFTKRVNEAFVDSPIRDIRDTVGKLADTEGGPDVFAMRRIVGAGDEITIICNARQALNVVKAYFDSLDETNKKYNEKYSACAGIAVFHSHAPFSAAYEIAEQCCKSGKTRIKALSKEYGDKSDSCYIDAYFIRGAITGTLDELRALHEAGRTAMPYCIRGNDAGHDFKNDFERIGNEMMDKLARTAVKTLRDAAFRSKADLDLELMRLDSDGAKDSLLIAPEDREFICDVAAFYDLWYTEES